MKFMFLLCAEDAQNQTVCRDPQRLNSKQINLFRYAVSNNYYFQMFLDELPIGGYVGVIGPASAKDAAIQDQLHLYTHMQFDIGYNNHQVRCLNMLTVVYDADIGYCLDN